jgi:hypothetical protein
MSIKLTTGWLCFKEEVWLTEAKTISDILGMISCLGRRNMECKFCFQVVISKCRVHWKLLKCYWRIWNNNNNNKDFFVGICHESDQWDTCALEATHIKQNWKQRWISLVSIRFSFNSQIFVTTDLPGLGGGGGTPYIYVCGCAVVQHLCIRWKPGFKYWANLDTSVFRRDFL